jgi:RND family efflux transporter MFP subunit
VILRWLLLGLLFFASCQKEAPKETLRPVKAIQIQEASAQEGQLLFPGSLRAFKRANLSFRVDGTLIKRDISVGQKVKKDELLIQLDPREYEVGLTKAKGKVASIQAQLNFASRDYERMKNIFDTDPGAISASLLDRKLETSRQLENDLIVAVSEMDKAADDLSYTSLKAPFDGIIAAIYVENHEQVRAKQNALRIIDATEVEMEIYVPEKYINRLLEGGTKLPFQVILDNFPDKKFPATIKEIGTESSSTTQTYPVTLIINAIPVQDLLLAGMSGKAILQTAKAQEEARHFKVPKSAIFSDNLGHTYVWVVDSASQTVQKRAVELEASRENEALIRKGVKPGEWVVTAGTSFLSDGQKVKLGQAEP